jgi:hypothetical protein
VRRWLVTLTVALVSVPGIGESQNLRVELAQHKVTTTSTLARTVSCDLGLAVLPAVVHLDPGSITVTVGTRQVRHAVRDDQLSWVHAVGSRVIVGYATGRNAQADTIDAFDLFTGALAWRRQLDSRYGTELVGDLLVVEREHSIDILDAATGQTVGTIRITGHGLSKVCRAGTSDIYLKTDRDLVAVRRDGRIRWRCGTSSTSNVVTVARQVVDGWVDRKANRFGIVAMDAASGHVVDSLDLGSTGGWYDFASIKIAPDGPGEVLVSAAFAVE